MTTNRNTDRARARGLRRATPPIARTSVESGENNKVPFARISWLAELQQIQIAIEAIDRSIDDERLLANQIAAAQDITEGTEANKFGYDNA